MTVVLVDSNVLLDVLTEDPQWFNWSAQQLTDFAEQATLIINPIVFAEISVGFNQPEEIEEAVPPALIQRRPLPYEAAFLAGKAFWKYRERGGSRRSPLPDFYIGAHAAVHNLPLLTRDTRRYRSYFPSVSLVAPDSQP